MLQICLDGPSGSGKSTLAKKIAKALDITYLDTGAMYRALTYYCLDRGFDANDEQAVTEALATFKLEVHGDVITVNGEDVSGQIRAEVISQHVSAVSSYEKVRTEMVSIQRRIAANQGIVMDGRDIGTVVLPDANYKFFLTASPEERARRRFIEQQLKGVDVTFETILEDMILRDHKDSTRALSPLKAAEDARIIDTTLLTLDQVVEVILAQVKV